MSLRKGEGVGKEEGEREEEGGREGESLMEGGREGEGGGQERNKKMLCYYREKRLRQQNTDVMARERDLDQRQENFMRWKTEQETVIQQRFG